MVTLVLSTIRAEMGKLCFELRGEMSELRSDLRADIAEVRGDVDALYRHTFGTPPSHGPRES
jgi:hypothetical protein